MLAFLFCLLLLVSCSSSKNETENGGIKNTDVIILSEEQVSNFVYVLPEIFDFSEKFHQRLSPQEREDPNSNKKFFDTLKKSKKIQQLAKEYNFKSIDELIIVYKNIVLGYMNIKVELMENFDEKIKLLEKIINSNENVIEKEFKEKRIDNKQYEAKKEDIRIKKARLQNMLIIKKYESEIDKISSQYNQ